MKKNKENVRCNQIHRKNGFSQSEDKRNIHKHSNFDIYLTSLILYVLAQIHLEYIS